MALRSTRSVLVRAPHVKLQLLRRLDDRLAADLDGLSVASDFGRTLCLAALENVGRGSMFTAAVGAIEVCDAALLDKLMAIAEAEPNARAGLVSAFGWVSESSLRGITKALLESANVFRRDIGLAARAMHQVDPGPVLASAIAESASQSMGSALNTVLLDVFINFPLKNRKRPKQRSRDVHRHVARCASIVAAIG